MRQLTFVPKRSYLSCNTSVRCQYGRSPADRGDDVGRACVCDGRPPDYHILLYNTMLGASSLTSSLSIFTWATRSRRLCRGTHTVPVQGRRLTSYLMVNERNDVLLIYGIYCRYSTTVFSHTARAVVIGTSHALRHVSLPLAAGPSRLP
jgi:hypothetical protein